MRVFNHRAKYVVYMSSLVALLAACSPSIKEIANPPPTDKYSLERWPPLSIAVKKDPRIEQRIKRMINSMTIEQKVAQMIQPEIRDITVEDMRRYGFGSYLNGGGAFPDNNKHATSSDWIALAESFYQASIDDSLDASTIPTMWGTDAVHGHNNVIGATLFPHNIALGATNNPQLVKKIARATAEEVMATGIDWVFAPTVAVVRDDRWGRTYEGYSEDPEITKSYAGIFVEGLQGSVGNNFLGDQQVIATVKHFLGDGGTHNGNDQGDNQDTEQQLVKNHAQGYISGLEAGAQTVMASFNSWQGKKLHGHKYLLTEVLKNHWGFDGFVVGDWNGHGQLEGCNNQTCSHAINAGLDVFMVPTQAWKPLLENTIKQVNSGEISLSRINDAVARILRVKLRAGLFDKPSPKLRALSGKESLIGSLEHRAIARQAVRESLVLLKNTNALLPLNPDIHVLVSGDGADNIGKQSGGWTITWQGTGNTNTDFPGASSIYDGINQVVSAAGGKAQLSIDGSFTQIPDVAIVVFGEEPYAEGNGDIDNLEYQSEHKTDLALLRKFKQLGIPVVSIFLSGRPLWVNPELNASDAFVAAWLPGSEGHGVADVIFTTKAGKINYDFTGKLSYSWPRERNQTTVNRFDATYNPLLPYGFGMKYGESNTLANNLPETRESNNSDSLTTLSIFNRTIKAPWNLSITDAEKTLDLNSSVTNTRSMSIKTTDRTVQEDARTVTWFGTGDNRLIVGSAFPKDFRAYSESNFMMSVDINVDEKPTEPVSAIMGCGPSCQGKVDITPNLQAMKKGQWNNILIELRCFSHSGADFSKIYEPFILSTSGKLTLSFSNIQFISDKHTSANVQCPARPAIPQ